jgi:hypothetical protein
MILVCPSVLWQLVSTDIYAAFAQSHVSLMTIFLLALAVIGAVVSLLLLLTILVDIMHSESRVLGCHDVRERMRDVEE